MNNYLNVIKEKIKKNIKIEKINILDNSHKHKTHKFYDENKFHIYLEIQSKYLNALPRIKAQRMIMNILKKEIQNRIHALEINIK